MYLNTYWKFVEINLYKLTLVSYKLKSSRVLSVSGKKGGILTVAGSTGSLQITKGR